VKRAAGGAVRKEEHSDSLQELGPVLSNDRRVWPREVKSKLTTHSILKQFDFLW
jgi:hypothetical protein